MTFKERVKYELTANLLNLREFAEERLINDILTPSLFGNLESKEYSPGFIDENGLYSEMFELITAKKYLKRLPKINEKLKVDDKNYYVTNVNSAFNMVKIKLRAYKS